MTKGDLFKMQDSTMKINVTYHNKKEKNTISIDTEKTFDRTQHP